MIKQVLSVLLLAFIFLASCQKDVTSKNAVSSDELQKENSGLEDLANGKVVPSAHWYGSYVGVSTGGGEDPDGIPDPDGDPDGAGFDSDIMSGSDQVFVSDSNFIKNGVAELPYLPNTFTTSNISFDIPSNYNISGDSLVFTAVAKNPSLGNFYDYDVILQVIGDQHSAQLHFVADAGSQQYTQYYVGSASFTNLPQLVNYFGDFKTIKLIMKKNQTAAYVNNILVYNFNYGLANRIGRLKTINIAGKGYVIVDNVSLTNSITQKKILTENFNSDGKSHTVFY